MAKHKFTRPDNPFSIKVVESMNVKTHTLLRMFKDFANEEKRENRRNDITSRLSGEVMKAYMKFKPNDRCSYESFVDMFFVSEVKHIIRDYTRMIGIERVTVSCDRPINGDDGEVTHVADLPSRRNSLEDGIDRFDFADIIKSLRRENRVYARIFSLRRRGYKLSEIYRIIGVPSWELYDILWPATRDAVKRIYDFHR